MLHPRVRSGSEEWFSGLVSGALFGTAITLAVCACSVSGSHYGNQSACLAFCLLIVCAFSSLFLLSDMPGQLPGSPSLCNSRVVQQNVSENSSNIFTTEGFRQFLRFFRTCGRYFHFTKIDLINYEFQTWWLLFIYFYFSCPSFCWSFLQWLSQ